MGKKYAALQRIDNDRKITKDTDNAFLLHLENALLLALKERGILNTMQYRYAEEKLMQQRRDWAGKRISKGDTGE